MNFMVDALSTGVVLGTPLALAALGELIAERAGVINLGVEGMMLVGAVVGFVVGVQTGGTAVAFLAAGAAGGLLALVHAFMTITLRVNQIVMGLTLTILGTGLSSFIGADYGNKTIKDGLGDTPIPLLAPHPGPGRDPVRARRGGLPDGAAGGGRRPPDRPDPRGPVAAGRR